MPSRYLQAIAVALSLSVAQATLEKRTVEDGQGDATAAGAHLAYGYNGTCSRFWTQF